MAEIKSNNISQSTTNTATASTTNTATATTTNTATTSPTAFDMLISAEIPDGNIYRFIKPTEKARILDIINTNGVAGKKPVFVLNELIKIYPELKLEEKFHANPNFDNSEIVVTEKNLVDYASNPRTTERMISSLIYTTRKNIAEFSSKPRTKEVMRELTRQTKRLNLLFEGYSANENLTFRFMSEFFKQNWNLSALLKNRALPIIDLLKYKDELRMFYPEGSYEDESDEKILDDTFYYMFFAELSKRKDLTVSDILSIPCKYWDMDYINCNPYLMPSVEEEKKLRELLGYEKHKPLDSTSPYDRHFIEGYTTDKQILISIVNECNFSYYCHVTGHPRTDLLLICKCISTLKEIGGRTNSQVVDNLNYSLSINNFDWDPKIYNEKKKEYMKKRTVVVYVRILFGYAGICKDVSGHIVSFL